MLNKNLYLRVITASILILILLPWLIFVDENKLPIIFFPIFLIALWEWARLLELSRFHAAIYTIIGLILCVIDPYIKFIIPGLLLKISEEPWAVKIIFVLTFYFIVAQCFWLIYVPYSLYKGISHTQPSPSSIKFKLERYFLMYMGYVVLIASQFSIFAFRKVDLFILLSTIWVADIAAYFGGKKFGKHKLAPVISPGKTIEGSLIGLVVALLYYFALNLSQLINIIYPSNYSFSKMSLQTLGYQKAIFIFSFLVAAGIIGDLFESLLKRKAKVKDSGICFPGHGGALDRIDALLPVLLFSAVYVCT